ncbi:hypothetical protein SCOR_07080 [Sulfidibacter corallicola]|uniref:Uncharacterized protein n=1 Tax=Sulfidibacter corallicola TaxID=2818388 RepID=A0A8A4TR63_SULCO|nr:hypothetical protein [Sulfidibacter corallicola]QTD51471.1 hypothetical protein J3U87_03290 [Sulfidibacter corallicola]
MTGWIATITLWTLLAPSQGLRIGGPMPLEPQSARFDGRTVIFESKSITCRLTAWEPNQLRDHLKMMGIDDDTVSRLGVDQVIDRAVTYMVQFENRSEHTLLFNPDQIQLVDKNEGPVATLLEMADLWPISLPEFNRQQAELASLFARGTVEVQPGKTTQQLLVFRSIFDRPWPKRVDLQIRRLYAGIHSFDIACRYDIKNPKD